ncbi:MAG: hypothetical protein WBC91_12105 [Phototrophicaceae bacterium]
MTYKIKIALLAVILLTTFGASMAQDNTPSETSEMPVNVSVPDGYEVQVNTDNDLVIELIGDDNIIRIFSIESLEILIETSDAETIEEIFLAFLDEEILDFELTDDDFVDITFEELSGLVYEADSYRAFALVSLSDLDQEKLDAIVLVEGDISDDVLLPLLNSISVSDTALAVCLVSTDVERTVRLHVGPGTNRTSVAFLPANQTFEALGEAEANDGSRWFKLDKSQAASNSSALEVWVAADLVMTSGDCTAVGEAFAPPIIPIIQQNPPTTSNSDSDDSDSNESSSTTSASGGLDVNNLGSAEITIELQEGIFVPTFNQYAYYVARVNESLGLFETELCARSSVSTTLRCSIYEAWQLVGLNTFQSTDRPSLYIIFNSETSYGIYSAENGGALNTFYVRSLDRLPDEFGSLSSLENR